MKHLGNLSAAGVASSLTFQQGERHPKRSGVCVSPTLVLLRLVDLVNPLCEKEFMYK